ncbi:MAG TPA: HD domain-containing protein [Anaeromyxobacteraceae bacterium]|nr:HD domain-containing protein [Anaeromyxobacteraceae bacterium]
MKSVFLVARKSVPTAKSGKTYLSVTLHDKTGELEARAFERVEELAQLFEEKDYLAVEGQVGTFQGKPQLRLEQVSKADPAGLEPAEFIFVPAPEPKKPEKAVSNEQEEVAFKELSAIVDAITDTHVKALIQAFINDEDVAARLRRAPAAKTVHHAYPGGLLEHTVSCLKLAHRLADHYPQIDRDLLVAGAFFHDLGKVRELSYDRQVEYSDEGRLIGHLVMTAQWIHDKARRVGIPRDLEQHIVHLVLAHHGRSDYGSPKPPMTLEALLTHELDEIDSRVNSWLNLMAREGGTRRWTDSSNVYGHHIWRGTLPTAQAEKKGPPPEFMTPVIYVPREREAARSAQPQAKKKTRIERKAPRTETPPQASASEPAKEKEAPQAAGPERRDRPERTERPPDRGFRGGPADRKRGYTGPRLPGDKGPQPRPKATASLTHNPFAALAQKIEGAAPTEGAGPGAEQAPPAPTEQGGVESEHVESEHVEVQAAPPPSAEPTPPTESEKNPTTPAPAGGEG